MSVDIKFKMDNREVSLQELKKFVTAPLMTASLSHIIETIEQEQGNQVCPIHNEPPHITIALMQTRELKIETTSCCQMFEKTVTAPLERTLSKTAYFNPGLKLILRLPGGKHSFIFDTSSLQKLDIGRTEADSAGDPPEVNLYDYQALEKGVSRRHASIIWQHGALHIVDSGSANGTYLNEKRLGLNEPHILHDGDILRLGQLILQVMLDSE